MRFLKHHPFWDLGGGIQDYDSLVQRIWESGKIGSWVIKPVTEIYPRLRG